MSTYSDKAERLELLLIAIAEMHDDQEESLVALQCASIRYGRHLGVTPAKIAQGYDSLLNSHMELHPDGESSKEEPS